MKTCCRCGETKEESCFSKLKQSKDGLRYACKDCMSKDYYTNLERRRKTIRNSTIKCRYGITQEEYKARHTAIKGCCEICGNSPLIPTENNLDIDHCHDTGKVRGLLCRNCNRGLGYFKDSQQNLINAAEYLKRNG